MPAVPRLDRASIEQQKSHQSYTRAPGVGRSREIEKQEERNVEVGGLVRIPSGQVEAS